MQVKLRIIQRILGTRQTIGRLTEKSLQLSASGYLSIMTGVLHPPLDIKTITYWSESKRIPDRNKTNILATSQFLYHVTLYYLSPSLLLFFKSIIFYFKLYNEKRICYYPSTFLFLTHPLSLILPLSIFIVAGNCKIKPKLEALTAQEEKGTEQGRRERIGGRILVANKTSRKFVPQVCLSSPSLTT